MYAIASDTDLLRTNLNDNKSLRSNYMSIERNIKRLLSSWNRPRILALFFLVLAGMFVTGPGIAEAQTVNNRANERYITIDFDNVDINLFIKYISELTGKNFIVDPAVKGNVTIISPTRISETDAYQVFESVLEIQGFTTVKAGSVIKIIPSVEARSKGIDTIRSGDNVAPEDRVVTQLVPLKYSTPLEMQKILQPLVSKTSVIIAHTKSGMLIITDILSNIIRLMSIIETLDVEYSREEIDVIALEHANAVKVATIINTIFQKATGAKQAARAANSAVESGAV